MSGLKRENDLCSLRQPGIKSVNFPTCMTLCFIEMNTKSAQIAFTIHKAHHLIDNLDVVIIFDLMGEAMKLAKLQNFGNEMIKKSEKYNLVKFADFVAIVLCAIQTYTKFGNFARLYFPHFTVFRNETF